MFSCKPLALPPQLDWQYQDEPALAEWSLKARAYNTDIANGLFVIFALISLAAAYWHSTLGGYHVVVDISLFGVLTGVALSMTHQKTKFAYRLTASGLEVCQWKEFPECLPLLMMWTAGITSVGMMKL